MASIKIGSDNAIAIDRKKRALELKNTNDLKKIFKSISNDVFALIKSGNSINAQEIAENYNVEFVKEIRDIMRKTIKIFGFSIRQTLEEKTELFFDLQNKFLEIDLDFKRVIEIEDATDSQIDQINKDFLLASSIFVANESEKQANFIKETNKKEIESAVLRSVDFYNQLLERARKKQQDLLNGNNTKFTFSKPEQLIDFIDNATLINISQRILEIESSRRDIVALNARKILLDNSQSRSELIAEQNIGLTESWARQEEAKLVNDAELITSSQSVIKIQKTWNAILDSKVREAHFEADGQTVGVKDFYIVGGESLMYPRDPNGSAGNTIRCRCVSEQSVNAFIKSIESIEKKEEIELVPTIEMANTARRALEWREKYNRGGTAVGVARARDISNRKNLSKETVGRMISFFARHKNNKSEFYELRDGEPTAWRIAWDLWGGNAGDSWSKSKWNQLNKD
jgi:hypothetical protein